MTFLIKEIGFNIGKDLLGIMILALVWSHGSKQLSYNSLKSNCLSPELNCAHSLKLHEIAELLYQLADAMPLDAAFQGFSQGLVLLNLSVSQFSSLISQTINYFWH